MRNARFSKCDIHAKLGWNLCRDRTKSSQTFPPPDTRSRREKASCSSGTSLADSVLCLSVELKKKLSLRLLTRGRDSAAGSPLRGSILCRPLRNLFLAKNVAHTSVTMTSPTWPAFPRVLRRSRDPVQK